MKLKPLHDQFIQGMKSRLHDWKFIASNRHFRLSAADHNWYLHFGFINHERDFDVTLDVAVEFMHGKTRLGIIGAELGNIQGTGQFRHGVASEEAADVAAQSAHEHFLSVGVPFLRQHSDRMHVLTVLRRNNAEARLICPIDQTRSTLVAALESAPTAP